MIKRKPYISIVINSNNNLTQLENCLLSLERLENVELIIINNFDDEAKLKEIEEFLDELNDPRIVFYQSKIFLSKNHARNLGINFASGSWIYFIDYYDQMTSKFVNFLNHYKLDPKMHFYRLQIMDYSSKKYRFNLFKTKYYSNLMATFLINSETINQFKFQFEDNIYFADSLVFIYRLYNIKNVNYYSLKRLYAIYHNFELDQNDLEPSVLEQSINQSFNLLLHEKRYWYKQYILILVYTIYTQVYLKQKQQSYLSKIKQMLKKSKIWFWHYRVLGFCFFWKTFGMRIKVFFRLRSKKA